MIKNIVCVECPMGCDISVEIEGDKVLSICGNSCVRGQGYAIHEITNPRRVLTTTVKYIDGQMLPVKTDAPILKSEMKKVMSLANKMTISKPVEIGEIIYKNVSENINLIATKSMKKK